MNGWAWVLWGYGVVLVSVGLYVRSLMVRSSNVERRLEELG